MREQIAQAIEAKRADLARIESLSGDALVAYYLPEVVNPVPAPTVAMTLNGEPVHRGSLVQPVAPGMPR
jgi:hypothetical protein